MAPNERLNHGSRITPFHRQAPTTRLDHRCDAAPRRTGPFHGLLSILLVRCTPETYNIPIDEKTIEVRPLAQRPGKIASETTPPPAPLRLEFGRRFSSDVYDTFAERSIDPNSVADDFRRSTGRLTLRYFTEDKLELGFFPIWRHYEDYERSGRIMFLSKHNGTAIALATRYNIQATYPVGPDPGFFGAKISGVKLEVDKDGISTETLKAIRVTESPSSPPDRGSAQFRTIKCNDIAILYFNEADVSPLLGNDDDIVPSINELDLEIENRIRESTAWLGEEFCLVSKRSVKTLTAAATRDPLIAPSLVLLLAVRRLLPLFPTLGGRTRMMNQLLPKIIERLPERGDYEPTPTPNMNTGNRSIARIQSVNATTKASDEKTNSLRFTIINEDRLSSPISLQLLGIHLPPATAEQGRQISRYINQVLGSSTAHFVPFDHGADSNSGLVFLADQRVVLNVEILQHGLARLDTENASALVEFPELVEAAADALRSGLGFAAQWRTDTRYTNEIERLGRK